MAVDRRITTAVIAVLTIAAAGACGGADDADDREQAASAGETKLAMMNDDVLKAMAEPEEPGRIIYDAPTDLSYASAQLRRPDLVRPDTSKLIDPARTAAPKDTTRGEAAAKPGTGGSRKDTTRQRP